MDVGVLVIEPLWFARRVKLDVRPQWNVVDHRVKEVPAIDFSHLLDIRNRPLEPLLTDEVDARPVRRSRGLRL